jgi:hypothetical protein
VGVLDGRYMADAGVSKRVRGWLKPAAR